MICTEKTPSQEADDGHNVTWTAWDYSAGTKRKGICIWCQCEWSEHREDPARQAAETILRKLCPDDRDLDAFLLDHFPGLYRALIEDKGRTYDSSIERLFSTNRAQLVLTSLRELNPIEFNRALSEQRNQL